MESIADQKLRHIAIAAKDLFWKYGFKKVSIEEVCREAEVSKMTFYKHFSNKTELVKYILSFISEESLKKFNSIMESDLPFKKKIIEQIKLKKEGVHGMSELFFRDWIRSDDPALIAYRNEITGKSMQQILKFYKDAQERGEIRKDIKPEFLLYFINHMTVMADDSSLKMLYDTPEEMIMELMNFFFYGISVHE